MHKLALWSVAILAAMQTHIPPTLRDYRQWKPLTATAQYIPYQLAAQCATVTAVRDHGPHGDREVMVYANATALKALHSDKTQVFPPGSIIAKEKRLRGQKGEPEGVAFMIKHARGEFDRSDGWEFAYYSADAGAGTDEHCATCHRAGGAKDYVFGKYGNPVAN